MSSSYYRDIYTEQQTLRTKDTDKRKPDRRGRKVGIVRATLPTMLPVS